VAKVIERHGDRFSTHFTEAERARGQRAGRKKREDGGGDLRQAICRQGSLFQGVGTGIRRGVLVAGYGVVNLPGGRPTMLLTGGALARLERLTPPGMRRGSISAFTMTGAGAGLRHNFGGQSGKPWTCWGVRGSPRNKKIFQLVMD